MVVVGGVIGECALVPTTLAVVAAAVEVKEQTRTDGGHLATYAMVGLEGVNVVLEDRSGETSFMGSKILFNCYIFSPSLTSKRRDHPYPPWLGAIWRKILVDSDGTSSNTHCYGPG